MSVRAAVHMTMRVCIPNRQTKSAWAATVFGPHTEQGFPAS